MKKLVLAVSLFIAFAANAQHRNDERRNDKVEYHQGSGDFEGLRLSPRQEKEIFALSKQRINQREYDFRVKRILNKDQYVRYAQYHKNDFRDREVAMNRPFRK